MYAGDQSTEGEADSGRAKSRVLVVDDTTDTRELYAMCLRRSGFYVWEAADGLEALHFAEAHRPHVIVMDLAMPGLDGWHATRILKRGEHTRAAIILVVTGQVVTADLQRARDMGADDVLMKPCRPGDLVARVKAVLPLIQLIQLI